MEVCSVPHLSALKGIARDPVKAQTLIQPRSGAGPESLYFLQAPRSCQYCDP